MTGRWRALLAATVGAETAYTAVMFRAHVPHVSLLWLAGASALAVVAVVALRRCGFDARATAVVVVAAGALLQCAALVHSPLTSTDFYRYIWDGRVQLAGIDPYRYAPSAPQLSGLRDAFLFGPQHCITHFAGGCTAINRPDYPTVYPPLAEAAFVVLQWVSFGGALSYQIWSALGVVAVSVLVVRLLRRAGRPLWLAALWAWSPLVITEYGNNAHIDWLAVLLSLLAVRAAMIGHDGRAGAWIGAAAAVKLYPAVLLAALVRRRPWVVLVAAVAVFVAGYVPHVIAVGSHVVGFLPDYVDQEGYASGSRLLLLGQVLPHPVDTAVGALVLVAVALWCWRRSDPADPARTAVILLGAVFLVATPSNGWYAGLLLALVAVSGRWEWTPLTLAPTTVYLLYGDVSRTLWPGSLTYLVAGVAVLGLWIVGRRRGSAPRPHRAVALEPAG